MQWLWMLSSRLIMSSCQCHDLSFFICQDLSLSIVYNSLWLVHPSSTKESFVLLMSGYLIVFNRNRIFRIVGHVKPSSHSFLVSLSLSFIFSVFKKKYELSSVFYLLSVVPPNKSEQRIICRKRWRRLPWLSRSDHSLKCKRLGWFFSFISYLLLSLCRKLWWWLTLVE